MKIFHEILWQDFCRLNEIRNLSLNEQVAAYRRYLNESATAHYQWLQSQPKGTSEQTPQTTPEVEMLTESGDVLLTESGDTLIL